MSYTTKCPQCGYPYSTSFNPERDYLDDVACEACNFQFLVVAEKTYRYVSRCKFHVWLDWEPLTKLHGWIYRECSLCDCAEVRSIISMQAEVKRIGADQSPTQDDLRRRKELLATISEHAKPNK